jgi:hypothetical protein
LFVGSGNIQPPPAQAGENRSAEILVRAAADRLEREVERRTRTQRRSEVVRIISKAKARYGSHPVIAFARISESQLPHRCSICAIHSAIAHASSRWSKSRLSPRRNIARSSKFIVCKTFPLNFRSSLILTTNLRASSSGIFPPSRFGQQMSPVLDLYSY